MGGSRINYLVFDGGDIALRPPVHWVRDNQVVSGQVRGTSSVLQRCPVQAVVFHKLLVFLQMSSKISVNTHMLPTHLIHVALSRNKSTTLQLQILMLYWLSSTPRVFKSNSPNYNYFYKNFLSQFFSILSINNKSTTQQFMKTSAIDYILWNIIANKHQMYYLHSHLNSYTS